MQRRQVKAIDVSAVSSVCRIGCAHQPTQLALFAVGKPVRDHVLGSVYKRLLLVGLYASTALQSSSGTPLHSVSYTIRGVWEYVVCF